MLFAWNKMLIKGNKKVRFIKIMKTEALFMVAAAFPVCARSDTAVAFMVSTSCTAVFFETPEGAQTK